MNESSGAAVIYSISVKVFPTSFHTYLVIYFLLGRVWIQDKFACSKQH